MVKKAKKNITIKDVAEDVGAFSLLAIRSAEPDTRMAWLLNRALHLDFVHYRDLCGREPDSPLQPTVFDESKPEERRQFAVFCATDSLLQRSYILITNRQGGESLVKKLAQVDYLLKIPEALHDDELATLGAAIRAIPGVQACITVTDESKNEPLLVTLEA
ncbi:MAG: IPExxxVDY family protein [Prevotellaceae bacterium]|jgi:hypothetical protein|nr:IPExxxVDY family protein [Prevotellaceae bacterium]